jgi:hypothetical protein
MKFHTLTVLCTIASALIATAQVPSLINYQGRLTNANGDPVTGSKNFAISIYDAATNGTLLYTETIGAVTLDDNGVYSFQFGGSGTSNTLVTETVATTDGTATTFQKVLANSPVVANSVSVSDGTYTWSQSAGSSNEDQFGVAYSSSLRRVTVNYYNGAPASSGTITAIYRCETNSITGALSSGAEHWIAISVDGTTQGARQRVLAVPFAMRSVIADFCGSKLDNSVIYPYESSGNSTNVFSTAKFDLNKEVKKLISGEFFVEWYWDSIYQRNTGRFTVRLTQYPFDGSGMNAKNVIESVSFSPDHNNRSITNLKFILNRQLDWENNHYRIEIFAETAGGGGAPSSYSGVKVYYEK